MDKDNDTDSSYIKERIDSLNLIDAKVATFLDNLSKLFKTYCDPDHNDSTKSKDKFSAEVKDIYGTISNVAIELRKEVKLMDDNIGVYDRNKDGVMILPIKVDQRNTSLGKEKLKEELQELSTLLGDETSNAVKQEATSPKADIQSNRSPDKDKSNIENDNDVEMIPSD